MRLGHDLEVRTLTRVELAAEASFRQVEGSVVLLAVEAEAALQISRAGLLARLGQVPPVARGVVPGLDAVSVRQSRLIVPTKLLGQSARCPGCKNVIPIPERFDA